MPTRRSALHGGAARLNRSQPITAVRSARASRIARRALRTRAVAVVAALAVTLFVIDVLGDARRERASLGPTTPVLVATRDMSKGTLLGAGAVHVEQRPVSMVPRGTLASLDELSPAARTRIELASGEMVAAHRVSSNAASPTAAALSGAGAAVAIPVDPTVVPLHPGDLIDVIAATPGLPIATAARVASSATVLEVTDQRAVIAVRADEVLDLGEALMAGPVVVAVLGPSGARHSDVVDGE